MKIKKAKCCGTCKSSCYYEDGQEGFELYIYCKFHRTREITESKVCDEHDWEDDNGMDSGG